MILVALCLGFFGYSIYGIGLLQVLYPPVVQIVTVSYWGLVILLFRKSILRFLTLLPFRVQSLDTKSKVVGLLIVLLASVNLVGALGPELAFDAIWYHLTLPKMYLLDHAIHVIRGGLLYYSGMPQLGEMYYIVALVFHGEILAKFIHFLFGILCCITLYIISRKVLSVRISSLVVLIFYSNLVVSWESTTAYIDLIRTFFEISAIYSLLFWREIQQVKYLKLAGVLLGFAVGVKLLAIASYPLFCILIILFSSTKSIQLKMKAVGIFTICFLAPTIPWMLSAFMQTGNPLYPFFSVFYHVTPREGLLNPITFISSLWNILTQAADPVSPLYVLCLPLILFIFRNLSFLEKSLCIYSIGSLFIWYLIPDTGGGRFIVPYLPLLSVAVGIVIRWFLKTQKVYAYLLIGISIMLFATTFFYRGVANARYLPVITGRETKREFLTGHLNFSFGDFYDTDGYFKQEIKPSDVVLLYGFHNLYYVDFPFVDSSWRKYDDRFTHVATQGVVLPQEFSTWQPIYYNKITDVTLYTKPQ